MLQTYAYPDWWSNNDAQVKRYFATASAMDVPEKAYPLLPSSYRDSSWDGELEGYVLSEFHAEFDHWLRRRNDTRPLDVTIPLIVPDAIRHATNRYNTLKRVKAARLAEETRRAALTPAERDAADGGDTYFDENWFVWADTKEQSDNIPPITGRGVENANFRDDAPLEWEMQDREFDWDWFNERPGVHFRLTSAFESEAFSADILPLEASERTLRLTRFSPSDAIPVSRVLVIPASDVAMVNAATPAELAALWTFEASEPPVAVARGSVPASSDFDLRGVHSPLHIVRNPVLPASLRPKATPKPFADRTYTIDFTEEDLPKLEKREWLVPGLLSPRVITQIVAEGSAGKSLFSLQLAIALARGDGDFAGIPVTRRAKVLVVNMEDEPVDQKARVAAVCKHFDLALSGLRGWLHIYNPLDGPVKLAVQGKNGMEEGPDVAAIDQYVTDNQIDVVIYDPLIEMRAGGKEGDNDDMNGLMSAIKGSARRSNYVPLIINHTRKPTDASSKGFAGNPHSARGASATVAATRLTFTMCRMTQDEATNMRVPAHEAHRYVRMDDAKTNYAEMSSRPRWFKKVSVRLPNGETSVALEPVFVGDTDRERGCRALTERLMLEAIDAGVSLTPKAQARDKYAPKYLEANQGADTNYTAAEFAKQIDALVGFAFRVENYDNKKGNKEAQRYVR